MIKSIRPEFNGEVFNFNKVDSREILFECQDDINELLTTFLINNSPLTKYHSLICPNLRANQAQILSEEAIRCAVDILTGFEDRSYRIGYNSPGALASVNHMHLHLMFVEERLYVEVAVSD